MAYRFVRARPKRERLPELRDRLADGDIEQLDPFGRAMTTALENARFDPATDEAVWIEEDYCTPPLAMERDAVLEEYFDGITVVADDVDETVGRQRIDDLPGLWEQVLDGA